MAENDGIAGALKARLSSEILGTFSLSLMLCCWKVWIYAFSSETATWKIQQIDGFLYSQQMVQALFEALAATVVILFAIPTVKTNYEIWLLKNTSKLRISQRKLAVSYVIQTRNFINNIKGVHNLNNRVAKAEHTLDEISIEIARIANELRGDSPFKESLVKRVAMIAEQRKEMKKWISRLEDFEAVATELGFKLEETAKTTDSSTV